MLSDYLTITNVEGSHGSGVDVTDSAKGKCKKLDEKDLGEATTTG
jgi:hypothetical protein